MPHLNILRHLVDNQQFHALKEAAFSCWEQTGDHRSLSFLALAHAQLGERREAIEAYDAAGGFLAGFDDDARVDLAGVDCVLLRIDAALSLLEPVVAKQPEHALALARLAWCRMQQNRLDEARQLYLRATALNSKRLPVWLGLIRLQLQAKETTSAQETLQAALRTFEQRSADLPESVVQVFTAQLRGLQLAIWVAGENLEQAEAWLEQRRPDIGEDEWVALLCGYADLLAGNDLHAQAGEALCQGLTCFPDQQDLLLYLAELAEVQGHFMEAVRALRRAIRLDRDNPALWCRLANACRHRLDKQARTAAEKAVELADRLRESEANPAARIAALRAQAKTALAQVESQEQHFAQAQALFDEVLATNPWFVPALQGLGQQYMQEGKIDAALELFARIKQVDPLKGHSALINARHFPDDIETLERMETSAQTPSLEGRVRSGILFQLASAWEKRADYDRAFACAKQANEGSRKFLPYDRRAHRNSCARIRRAFSRALYEHRRDCGVESSLPVFVVGMPRSGTTLVEQIIAGHSRIFGAGELGLIPQRIAGLNRWERHVGSGRRYPDCIDDLSPYVTAGIARGLIDELKELAAEDKPQAEHVVDKLPHNFENIGFVKFLFPKARIISVRRDPRDIAISNYFTDYQAKHGGMGFAYDLRDIGEQLADHNLLMHHWHQVFPGEILEIRYEEVVEDLEGTARKLLAYIGVDWEPQVLRFNELERPVKTASVWQVRQPIYTTSKARWRRYQPQLAPLIQGTNAGITWDPIEDMLTLPEPGFLQQGVELYRKGDLDGAELSCKKMLHHNPGHAACNYMVGLVYCSKGHVAEALAFLEKAVEQCPWQEEWRQTLAKAYDHNGQSAEAEALLKKRPNQRSDMDHDEECAAMESRCTHVEPEAWKGGAR